MCWQVPLTEPEEDSHTFSAPLISGGTVFLDADGDVFAVGLADGLVQWRWDSGSPTPLHSDFAGNRTVAVSDGVLVATRSSTVGMCDPPVLPWQVPGAVEQGYVVGLNERTGAVDWQSPSCQYTSGPFDTGDGSVVFIPYQGALIEVLDDRTGTRLWSAPWPPQPSGELTGVWSTASVAGRVLVEDASGGVDALRRCHRQGGVALSSRWRGGPVVDGLVLLTPRPPLTPGFHDLPTVAVDPTSGRTLWTSPPVDPASIFAGAGTALMHIEDGPNDASLSRSRHVEWAHRLVRPCPSLGGGRGGTGHR